MIDERINRTLTELEQSLRTLDSSKTQVENIIHSNKELSDKMNEYVANLSEVTSKVKSVADAVSNGCTSAIERLNESSNEIIGSSKDAVEHMKSIADETIQEISDRMAYYDNEFGEMKAMTTRGYIMNLVIVALVVVMGAVILLVK